MRRRKFITTIAAGAAVWPLVARGQRPGLPVVGFLHAASAESYAPQLAAFLKGLAEAGYVDGRNVAVEYRWAEGRNEQLPALAADLVHRQVTVIAATTTPAALAAKATTTTIPIVFEVGSDPVLLGLVASLNRPGGNVTGVTNLNIEVTSKRLELLHELVPTASVMALLLNPADPVNDAIIRDVQAAARGFGLELYVLNASTEHDLDAVFAKLIQLRAGGLVIVGNAFFNSRREKLASLAVHHAVPTVFQDRRFVAAGGLMSYGGSFTDAYRLAGVYTGRILKGEKPAELPVQQGTKVELYINLTSARALGLDVPNTLVGRADEIIE